MLPSPQEAAIPEPAHHRDAARAWLATARHTSGAWPYLAGGPPRLEPTVFASATVPSPPLAWLAEAPWEWPLLLGPALLSRHPDALPLRQRLLERILETRSVQLDTPWTNGQLVGWPWYTNTYAWVEPTAFALLSLRSLGRADHPRYAEGLAILADRRCADGGWNYGNDDVLGSDLPSYVESTAWVLQVLDPGDPMAADALARLDEALFFPSTRTLALTVLARVRHGLPVEPHVEALLALRAGDGSFGGGRVDATALALLALDAAAGEPCPLWEVSHG